MTINSTAFTIMDELKQWFLSNGLPYWTIYRGKEKASNRRIATNDNEKEINASWDRLKTTLIAVTRNGGTVSIFQATKPNGNSGFTTIFTTQNTIQNTHQIAGTPNPMAIPGEWFSKAQVNGIVSEALDKRDLEDEIDARDAEIEALKKSTPLERIFSNITGSEQIMSMMAAKLLGPQLASVAVNGAFENTSPELQDSDADVPTPDEMSVIEYDEKFMKQFFAQIKEMVPDENPYEMLNTLLGFLQANKETILATIKNTKS